MQIPACTLAALSFVAIAGCARAPSFDEEGFGGTGPELFDAGPGLLDAGSPVQHGSEPQVRNSSDASAAALGGDAGNASERAPLMADAATTVFDAAFANGPTHADASQVADRIAASEGVQTDASEPVAVDADAPTPDASNGAEPRDAAAAACSPLTCRNNCLALPRCCTDENECACFNLAMQQCNLQSL